jgi:hypothetical protein
MIVETILFLAFITLVLGFIYGEAILYRKRRREESYRTDFIKRQMRK